MPESGDGTPARSRAGLLSLPRRVIATVVGWVSGTVAGVRRVLAAVRRRLAAMGERVAAVLAPIVGPPLRVLRWCGRVIGRIADVLWRIPLVVAAVAMGMAAVVHARGNQDLAWTLVTGGFAIGLLGVPLGLISVGLGRKPASEVGPDVGAEAKDDETKAAVPAPSASV